MEIHICDLMISDIQFLKRKFLKWNTALRAHELYIRIYCTLVHNEMILQKEHGILSLIKRRTLI